MGAEDKHMTLLEEVTRILPGCGCCGHFGHWRLNLSSGQCCETAEVDQRVVMHRPMAARRGAALLRQEGHSFRGDNLSRSTRVRLYLSPRFLAAEVTRPPEPTKGER